MNNSNLYPLTTARLNGAVWQFFVAILGFDILEIS
jgi:hypothetical protein